MALNLAGRCPDDFGCSAVANAPHRRLRLRLGRSTEAVSRGHLAIFHHPIRLHPSRKQVTCLASWALFLIYSPSRDVSSDPQLPTPERSWEMAVVRESAFVPYEKQLDLWRCSGVAAEPVAKPAEAETELRHRRRETLCFPAHHHLHLKTHTSSHHSRFTTPQPWPTSQPARP
jgi:hypothetical protein